jgi:hypothetical protein
MKQDKLLADLKVLKGLDSLLSAPRLTVLAESLEAIVCFAFSSLTFKAGDRVSLCKEIDFFASPGWKLDEDILQVGAVGYVRETNWYGGASGGSASYAVEFDSKPGHHFSFNEEYLISIDDLCL